jgi:diaminohydroxyphosphoribosylaminopyrimidine deaminase/5-amino-6-(5-phosphoribosylamino)uracil reductase
MQHALELATKGQGLCAPNPAVGAVLVRNNVVISEGFHHGPGLPHAEVEALFAVEDQDISDCELYVTLEPCCHHGRTPPCTDLIVQQKLHHVYFSYYDPNPLVAGRGQQLLREAGMACDFVENQAANDFYQPYQFWWQHKRPYVTLKCAITEARQLAIDPVTGIECQRYTQAQRIKHDALLTTIETILCDRPQFNARLIDDSIKKPLYILDSNARLPLDATVLLTCDPVTLFHADDADQQRIALLEQQGVRCVAISRLSHGLDLSACLQKIGADGKHSLWVEAGWTCVQSFLRAGFSERIIFYIAPKSALKTRAFEFIYEQGQQREITIQKAGADLIVILYNE